MRYGGSRVAHGAPDIFSGLRGPPKGLLLFGPPGTVKTMIERSIVSKCGAHFFNISVSRMVSNCDGAGEKTVSALFDVAGIFEVTIFLLFR